MDRTFDTTDERIVEILREEPRVTNKDIAKQLSIAETTVALRIKNMGDRNTMRVVAQQHVFSDGYTNICPVFVNTSGQPVQNVCKAIGELDHVMSVSQGIGNPDIFVNARTSSTQDIRNLSTDISAIKGVSTIEATPCFAIHKFSSDVGDLTLDSIAQQPSSEDVTANIFQLLNKDGRTSNREVARQLGLSEGAVRQRLNKLLSSGALRFQAVCNPTALGITATGILRITTIAQHTSNVIASLTEMSEIGFVGEVAGEHNVLALATTADTLALGNLCDNKLMSIKGVHSLVVQLLVANTKHQYHLAYFEGPAEVRKRK